MKLCIDCRHYGERAGWTHGGPPGPGCSRPLTNRVDPVHGGPADRLHELAANERRPGRTFFGRRLRCGPDAIWFEAKDVESWGYAMNKVLDRMTNAEDPRK